LTAGFHLRTLSFGRPHDNHRTHFRYGFHIPRCRGRVVRGVGCCVSSFLLCLFTVPVELSRFASSVITPRGYKTGDRSCATYILPYDLPPPSLWLKRKRDRETYLENMRELLNLWGVVSPSLLIHCGVGLDRVGGHTRAPVKPRELGVYDSSGVGYLLCARGFCISCSDGGIRRGVCGVLRVRIWCAITPISLLFVAVL
jgi:hypothetical protein